MQQVADVTFVLRRRAETRDSTDMCQNWGALGGSAAAESLLQVEDKIGQRESRCHAGPDNDLSELFVNVEDALDHAHFKKDDGASIAPAHPLAMKLHLVLQDEC